VRNRVDIDQTHIIGAAPWCRSARRSSRPTGWAYLAYGRADAALHEVRALLQSYQLVSGRVAALRTNLSSPIDVQTPASFDEHRMLLRLFERGDFAAFEKLMTSHVSNSGLTYARALEVA
jgi:DNA-binding GntR family transcriptional regulator